MPRPTKEAQEFRAVSLVGIAERSWMEFMLFQPGAREGGDLHERSIDLGDAYADLSLTLFHTPDPTPEGVRGWELVAAGRRENSAAVSLEEPGVRGGTPHLILPLGSFCRACEPALCDGLTTALVLYASSALQATTVSLTAAEVARCLLLRAKHGGKRSEIWEEDGPDQQITMYTLKDNLSLVVVENLHLTRTARVKYDMGGENITCSRGQMNSVDTIAPRHFQVLRVDSEIDHRNAWSWRSSTSTRSYVHSPDRGEAHQHEPAIEQNSVHSEYPL